jgi:hypothetical protein
MAMFTTTSRYKVQHLRGALQNAKKNEMTPANFFTKMKGFTSEILAIGKPVEKDELVGFILNRNDGSYNSLVSSVNANPCTGLDDLYDQICSHDQRHAMLSEIGQDAGDFHSSANVTQRGCSADRHRRPRHDDRAQSERGDHGDHGEHGYHVRQEEDRRWRDE